MPDDRDAPNPHDFRVRKVVRAVGFAVRSARRHPAIVLAAWAGTVAAVALGAWALPATYEVRCELVATSRALDRPADDARPDGPSRVAAVTMLGDAELLAIVRDTDLVDAARRSRPPARRALDAVRSLWARPATREEQEDGLVSTLDKRLVVTSRDDGAVEMTLHWPDPIVAYRVLDAAQETFLEKAHGLEVDAIADAIAVLETRARAMKTELERRIRDLRGAGAGVSLGLTASRDREEAVSADAMRLRIALAAKRRSIADIVDLRRRHAAELEAWIAGREAAGASSGAIAEARRSARALLADSPQLTELRDEEAFLARELRRRAVPAGDALSSSDPDLPWLDVGGGREPALVDSAQAETAAAVRRYDDLLDRIEAARVALDLQSVRFRDRYLVVLPPEVPPDPIRPSRGPVLLAALLDGLLVALLAAALAARRRGAFPDAPDAGDVVVEAARVAADDGA